MDRLDILHAHLAANAAAIERLEDALRDRRARAAAASGAVPEQELIAAWAASPKATARDQAIATAELLAQTGFGHLPGAQPAAIERRIRRLRVRGASGQSTDRFTLPTDTSEEE